MAYDLTGINRQRDFTPIPPGLYRLKARLKPGGTGEGGLLRLAKNQRTSMVDFEHTVIGGEYDGRKIFDLVTITVDLGESADLPSIDAEQARRFRAAVNMGLTRLRAMLESAYEISPDNAGDEEAQRVLKFESVSVFDNLEFWAEVDIRNGENGFRDRNYIFRIVLPGDGDWPTTTPAQPSPQPPPLGRDMEDEIPF